VIDPSCRSWMEREKVKKPQKSAKKIPAKP